jgi:hypothetical protein
MYGDMKFQRASLFFVLVTLSGCAKYVTPTTTLDHPAHPCAETTNIELSNILEVAHDCE